MTNSPNWLLYILVCKSKSGKIVFYTGITNRWEKRFDLHKKGKGAKFTKTVQVLSGNPVVCCLTHSEALKLERRVKRMPAKAKKGLLCKNEGCWLVL